MVKGYVEWARASVIEYEVEVGKVLHVGVRTLDFFFPISLMSSLWKVCRERITLVKIGSSLMN